MKICIRHKICGNDEDCQYFIKGTYPVCSSCYAEYLNFNSAFLDIGDYKDSDGNELPYFKYFNIGVCEIKKYNANYGDDRVCVCGHTYDRHFDYYENYAAVGCKYCGCEFEEADSKERIIRNDAWSMEQIIK
jgi:hypothetical protein